MKIEKEMECEMIITIVMLNPVCLTSLRGAQGKLPSFKLNSVGRDVDRQNKNSTRMSTTVFAWVPRAGIVTLVVTFFEGVSGRSLQISNCFSVW